MRGGIFSPAIVFQSTSQPMHQSTLSLHYLLVGNYGVGNLGDEALREYFLQAFPEMQWTVLSARPDRTKGEVARFPGGIRSLLSFQWFKTLRALRRSDGMVFGGGSLFTDAESAYACFLWWIHVQCTRLCGKPVLLAFQGIGPFRTRVGEWFARSAVRSASFLSVRDALSAARMESWEKNTKIIQSFDPVYLLLYRENSYDRSKKVFTIIPRENAPDTFIDQAVFAAEKYDEISIFLLCPESAPENAIADQIKNRLDGKSVTVIPIHDVTTLGDEIGKSSSVFTARYHGAIAALACGVPFTASVQADGDKLASLEGLSGRREELAEMVRSGERELRQSW